MSRLYYVYEQHEGEKQRFIYFCSSCGCVLRVERNLWPVNQMIESLNGRCIGCGCVLEGRVECRLTAVPEEWVDIRLTETKAVEKKDPRFLSASSFPHFSLGFPTLDAMLRPFTAGRTIALNGSHSSTIAELAAFRAQLPYEMGGLNSTVLYIDGGNRSDPYLFSSFARQRAVRPKLAMRRVTTCRVFTFYQLADLISNHLFRAVQDYAAQLVIISDVLGTLNEPGLYKREARRLLTAIEQGLKHARKHTMILLTMASPNKYDDAVESWADTVVRTSVAEGRVRAQLVKHPDKPPATSSFKLNSLLKLPKSKVAA